MNSVASRHFILTSVEVGRHGDTVTLEDVWRSSSQTQAHATTRGYFRLTKALLSLQE